MFQTTNQKGNDLHIQCNFFRGLCLRNEQGRRQESLCRVKFFSPGDMPDIVTIPENMIGTNKTLKRHSLHLFIR